MCSPSPTADRSIPDVVLDAALAEADAAFTADFNALISAPWPEEAKIRAGTAIAGLPARPVPGQRAISARSIRRAAA